MQMHTHDLVDAAVPDAREEQLAPGAWLLRGFALDSMTEVLAGVGCIQASAPFRHWMTRSGFRMSVAMTNCGRLGWVSDRAGYRYEACDPLGGRPWPPMPSVFLELAQAAALAAKFPNFVPDACLLNRYEPGARLTLHQDKDERDFGAPIVSVSLGLPAVFLFGGNARTDLHRRVALHHGDVVVWGGPARLRHHGVLALKDGHHEVLGSQRINLTFRKAG
jgi:alkylated DNA repair protein (DNA oxidative demethylase)